MPAGPTPITLGRERRIQSSRDALVRRIYGEFHEMPCLRLTPGQAQRLFDLRPDVCQRILTSLMREGKLACDAEQRYRLDDSRSWPVGRMFANLPTILRSRAS
jgi:hypothetical protein